MRRLAMPRFGGRGSVGAGLRGQSLCRARVAIRFIVGVGFIRASAQISLPTFFAWWSREHAANAQHSNIRVPEMRRNGPENRHQVVGTCLHDPYNLPDESLVRRIAVAVGWVPAGESVVYGRSRTAGGRRSGVAVFDFAQSDAAPMAAAWPENEKVLTTSILLPCRR